ncbi:histidine kinase dimerization/phosphoacceptor domain -containing protein [Algoriphagus sp. A40]|uniref:histidine kinase dimerization/phosphoacceptor domain -containing protein n=1 Tax=Algoriphagus sp. A40 TaxID=1945863 RepID=UPI0009875B65|nr:histidine kinase dimerization/phosphoacceptor domain -containing protein [Algoriphagus sp. A40]OOG70766.1 histidine kinase [Algoriphagus sp. A40]
MKGIWILLLFSTFNLTFAQVVKKNGFFQYKEVFVQTDDFGRDYLAVMEEALAQIQSDSLLRLRMLNDLGYYHHTRNLNQALEFLNQGLEEANILNNTYWQGKLQVSQGAILLRMEELDLAELVLKNAQTKIPEKEWWLLYTNLGYVYERRGKLGEAFDFAAKTLKIGETYHIPKAIAMAYSDMSNLFWKQGKFAVGLDYGLKSLAIFEEIGMDDLDYDFTLHVVGNNLVELGRHVEAKANFEKSIQIGEKYGFYNNLSDSYIALSELNTQVGNFSEAVTSGNMALKYAELLGNKFMIMRSYLSLGKASNAAGNFSEAAGFLEKSIQAATPDFGDKYYLSLVYLELSKALEGGNQFAKALEATRTYDQLRQDVFTDHANEQISFLQTQMELTQKESTIKLQEAKLAKNKIIQAFILTLSGILVVFLFVLYRIFLRKKKYSRLLEKKNLEKEFLLKEIHHRVKNNLETISSLLSLQTAQIENPEFQAIMEETQNRVHSMGMIHKRLYQGENIKSIEMKDFFESLGNYIIDTFDASGRIRFLSEMEPLELDVDLAIPIGLIVNELISNSLKYAFPKNGSGEIGVRLLGKGSHLHLMVSDNGIGMPEIPQIHGSGFGSELIRLLTKQLDGKMTLLMQEGTEFSFEFQINKAA